MEIYPFLPMSPGFNCDGIRLDREAVVVRLTTRSSEALCPACGQPSHRIHSRYERTLADLSWMGMPVRLLIQVRRFFCDTPTCPYRIFSERLPEVAAAHARKTCRLTQTLCQIGLALGGEAGSRLSRTLSIPTSGDTILRLLHHLAMPLPAAVQVLGVDDWAWHEGRRYGTILYDLERHRVIDLLPDRSADQLSDWLKPHPEISIISRDRSGSYQVGAQSGAPQATQVADRFHLLVNLRQALIRMLNRYPRVLQKLIYTVSGKHDRPPPSELDISTQTAPAPSLNRNQQSKEASRTRRRERYDQVLQRHEQGHSIRRIAQEMGMHRETVRKFLRAGQFSERAAPKPCRRSHPFEYYLRQCWDQGCRNAAQLCRELGKRGHVY